MSTSKIAWPKDSFAFTCYILTMFFRHEWHATTPVIGGLDPVSPKRLSLVLYQHKKLTENAHDIDLKPVPSTRPKLLCKKCDFFTDVKYVLI